MSKTKAERRHLDLVAALGCLPCRMDGNPGTPPELHHPRAGVGMGRRSSHSSVIPLCSHHHRGTNHPATPSIHLDKHRFIAIYGTETELLEQTRSDLEKLTELFV